MSKVLLINPNKWGRGITSIWIASHAGLLKSHGHTVELFDCTFYTEWTVDEIGYNTSNMQHLPSDYKNYIVYRQESILDDFIKKLDEFNPDIIFWSALSSHIHGEGEYVNIQYGYELAKLANEKTLLITGGLQATAIPADLLTRMPLINVLTRGESEKTLLSICEALDNKKSFDKILGIAYKSEDSIKVNKSQPILKDLDTLTNYDYSIFDDQTFFRPYNGAVVRAVDYEISRGCIYACAYCVETVIQDYYGFSETNRGGSIKRATEYLRSKSPERIMDEINSLINDQNIFLLRCQDTNFLTINRSTLQGLADLFDIKKPNVILYIETRPEGVNKKSVELMKRLKIDGIGMGIELATQEFREDKLKRFASQEKIVAAFKMLKEAGIKRTAYNIIGLPEQDEKSILETIQFNRELNPDNITVAFYSPYQGTAQQKKANELGYFNEYEFHVDGQLRTVSKHSSVNADLLCFYKAMFNKLVKEGLDDLDNIKEIYFNASPKTIN